MSNKISTSKCSTTDQKTSQKNNQQVSQHTMQRVGPKLDPRLQAVLELVSPQIPPELHTSDPDDSGRSRRHADIGSDHAYLPIRIMLEKRAEHCIAVEVNKNPYEQASQAIAKAQLNTQINIDLRYGDGFAPLQVGEVNSASICGMGAHTICSILRAAGPKLPEHLILQCNDSPLLIRLWAEEAGFHIRSEQLIAGYWPYPILELIRPHTKKPDPAYQAFYSSITDKTENSSNTDEPSQLNQLNKNTALRYGPHLLREASELIRQVIQTDIRRLEPVATPEREAWHELQTARRALELLELIDATL